MLTKDIYRYTDFEKIFEIWNKAHPEDSIDTHAYIRTIFMDRNFREDDMIILRDGEKIAGFCYAPEQHYAFAENGVIESNPGYISFFAVSPDYDFKQTGSLILSLCEEHQRKKGKKNITTAYHPLYINQGFTDNEKDYIDLFISNGYKDVKSAYRTVDLTKPINQPSEEKRAALAEEGIYTGPLLPSLIPSYLSESAPFSSPTWAYEFRFRLESGNDFSSVHVASKDGKVIGACVFGDPNRNSCRFGPFGVSPLYRGKGIGTILLSDTFAEMKKRGLTYAWSQWTPLEGPAKAVYEKAGFICTKVYHTFGKELS